MTHEELTARLVEKVLGWRVRPDRFLRSGREWIRRESFEPLRDVGAAFTLLNALKPVAYELCLGDRRLFSIRIETEISVGRAMATTVPQTICLAIADALEIQVGEVE